MKIRDKDKEELLGEILSLRDQVAGLKASLGEQEEMKRSLHERETGLRLLVEQLPMVFWSTDGDLRFTMFLGGGLTALNLQPNQVVGRDLFEYFKTSDPVFLPIEAHRRVLRGECVDYEQTWQGRTHQCRVEPLFEADGVISGCFGVGLDVTDRKQAEQLQVAIYKIAEAAHTVPTLDDLYREVHRIIGEVMPATNFYIALYDQQKDLLTFPYFIDEMDAAPPAGRAGRGLTAYVLRTGKPLLCDATTSAELERQGEAETVGTPSPIWLGVPLAAEQTTIGVMAVQHYSDPKAYGEREKQILQFVSSEVVRVIDRKRAELALRENEEKFRKLAETATAAIFIYQDTGFRYINPAMKSITGYSEEELLKMNFWDFVHPDFRQLVKERGLARQKGETIPPRYSFMIVTKGGENRWVDLSTAIIEYEGHSAGLGTAYDITDHVYAADALRKSEEKYRNLFEESIDVVFITNPEGQILDINTAGMELFGYPSKQELLKADIARDLYYDPLDRERFEQALKRQGFVRDYEVTLKRKDGKKITVVETTTAVRDEAGTIVAYRGIMRDTTERKKLEEELRQSQKLESIGTLAGGIAHDFNNILGIVMGYTDVLEQRKDDPEKFTQSVEAISKATQRGSDLVRQILTFARKTDALLESINVNEIIQELAKLLAETFTKTITFEMGLGKNIASIIGDRSQLHQAFLNLCVNARDAMPRGGRLSITTEVAPGAKLQNRFVGAIEQQYVCTSFADTGVGMDENTKSRIFEPFFTTKKRGEGTGLGLAVVYGVVKDHGGFIDVESLPGEGTTFRMYFPVPHRQVERTVVQKKKLAQVSGGNETILVVEDEELLLDLVKTILERKGYDVLTAKDGVEAVEQYRRYQEKIALVLTDIGLPRLSGLEAFVAMRQMNPKLRTIIASGYLSTGLRSEMVSAGTRDFVQKPYDPSELLKKIREVLDSGSD